MKKKVLVVVLVVILVSGAVVGYLFLGRGDEEGELEGAPMEAAKTGETTPESRSLFLGGDKKETGIAHVSRRSLGLSPAEYARLMAKSRKLGAIPDGEQPVEIEEFDYLTMEDTAETRDLDVIEKVLRVAKEAQKQKFVVAAQPYIIVHGFAPSNPEKAKMEVAIPVVKTGDPKPPLILRHAKFGRAFVSEPMSPGKDGKVIVEFVTATIERAKKSGAKVSATIWARIENEDWANKGINDCLLRVVVPIE